MAKKPVPGVNFEEALKELEGLVERMERGNLALEESLQCFARGIALTRSCQEALQNAQQRVQMLVERHDTVIPTPSNNEE